MWFGHEPLVRVRLARRVSALALLGDRGPCRQTFAYLVFWSAARAERTFDGS